jgi:Ca2+-binding RTX toxin-like protein
MTRGVFPLIRILYDHFRRDAATLPIDPTAPTELSISLDVLATSPTNTDSPPVHAAIAAFDDASSPFDEAEVSTHALNGHEPVETSDGDAGRSEHSSFTNELAMDDIRTIDGAGDNPGLVAEFWETRLSSKSAIASNIETAIALSATSETGPLPHAAALSISSAGLIDYAYVAVPSGAQAGPIAQEMSPDAMIIDWEEIDTNQDSSPLADVSAAFSDHTFLTDYLIGAASPDASLESVNGRFDIVIRYTGDAAYASYFSQAQARWEQVIAADIADASYNGVFVDDLLIDANVSLIDGPGSNGRNILGQAGPDFVRLPSYLPIHGVMTFDSYDIAQMASGGTLDEVILHEMGHVLGVGSIWTNLGLRTGNSTYYGFIGPNALAEYRAMSGNSSATSVPVEPGTQGGSSGSHWAEAVFQNELMTPSTGPGSYMPLSRLTIASLADLGYTVNLSAADSYSFPGGGSAGSVSIGDASITESNGNQVLNFTVTRSGGSAAFSLNYVTADGTAVANSDYVSKSGSLSFGNGVNSQQISITILGDTVAEGTESFFVNLSGATNGANITDAQGQGTIFNDDAGAGSVTINDVTITEGNANTQVATFTVTRAGGSAAFTVNFATANGTATAGSDYVANSGTLNFGSGVNSQTISITINGDAAVEPNETFFVNLSGATNGATITDSQGQGTISNDDSGPGSITIDDITIAEGQSGTKLATFTVTRAGGTAAFNVNYATADGTATAGSDYASTSGTLSFAEGVNSRTLTVSVFGDGLVEANESFFVNLSGATNGATIADAQGQGVINNDDGNTPLPDDYADSYGDTTAPFGQLTVGGSLNGNLEVAGDRDWFRVSLTGGTTITIDLEGSPSNAGSLLDPYLYLYNGAGSLLAQDDDAGTGANSELIYAVPVSGVYYVAAAAYSDGYSGTYRVRVTSGSGTADDFADSLSDTGAPFGQVALNSSTTGVLETVGDRDWFRLQLAAGTTYTINLAGVSGGGGTLVDPYLRLYDNSGTVISENDDINYATGNVDSQLTFLATSTGTFYLAAAAFDDSDTGSYRVSLAASAPPLNQAPVLNAHGGGLSFTENQAATAIDTVLTASDADTATLVGATVSITGNFRLGEDFLTFTNQNGISGSYDVGTGVLSLAGTATVANYEAALRSVAYSNNTDTPSSAARTVSYVVNDGQPQNNLSNVVTAVVSVTPVNDAPSLIVASGSTAVGEFAANGALVTTFIAFDLDNTSFAWSLTSNPGGRFAIDNQGRLTVSNGLLLDYEQATSHSIGVRATDSGGLFVERAFTVTVNDVNPENITGDGADNVLVGGALDDVFHGAGGNDRLTGGGGNDQLDGGAGIDTMIGGTGNDAYLVDNGNDVVTENPADGTGDTVFATVDYRLADNVELLVLQGSAVQGYGNVLNNTLYGTGGGNLLDGGPGADSMYGLGGDDTYFVDNPSDVIIETANEGTADTVFASIDYRLAANVENLVLQGGAGLQGYGNDQANVIAGNAGGNLLDGGLGADTMRGGAGSDAYFVDNLRDVVIENVNEGNDTVFSTAHYTLAANVETLVLQGGGDLQGYGNALANTLVGNAGSNILNGFSGADAMAGGAGDDFYFIDSSGDRITENAGEGNDTAFSTIDYTLPANVEGLVLQGSADLQGYGNGLANALNGNSGSNILNGFAGADAMAGGAGDDLYFVDNAGDSVTENANEGSDTVFSTVNMTLATNVERLVLQGGGDLQGYGNGLVNMLFGNAGSNILNGFAGADTMIGAAGDDFYFADSSADSAVENANEGSDTVLSTTHYTLAANVESLVLQGAADLQGYGNGLANTLVGNAGNNILNGFAGADAMRGGTGNDSYFVDDAGDQVVENPNEGTDTVYATAHLRLSANVETLVLQGDADLQGYGNALANTIYGNAGNNLLDGAGGPDVMAGGAGDDSYFVDDAGDAVIENANAGTDTVYATAHARLSANVENLVLQGGANLQGYGNGQANMVYGNSGNNIVDGGAGADVMAGRAGDDSYFVDDTADQVIENLNEGADTVYSTTHFRLAANVETLVLQGSADLQGYGGSQANTIYGNTGNNILDGGGGADTMAGGAGNDSYFIDNGFDQVIESAGQGSDTVFSSVHFILPENVENLVLQGSAGANGTGNALANSIYGNAGDNLLDGQGGADVLTGNAGNDTFVFVVGQADGDVIVDFAGNGASPGDSLKFVGYGPGATFTNINATHWQINYNSGASHEMIAFMNGAAIDQGDLIFA